MPAPILARTSTLVLQDPVASLRRQIRSCQGVAEWFRLQIKEKAWKGLKEHSLAGWNIGPVPYGYLADKVPHPVPAKRAEGAPRPG